MPLSPKPPRARCERCARPLSHCLCEYVRAVSNGTRVLVLQHPDEARHPLNTARLAMRGLQHAELWVGESFPQLSARLREAGQALLLFPASKKPSCASTHISVLPDELMGEFPEPGPAVQDVLLVVPDGTWRKATRIVNANPVLQTLPRLSFQTRQPSGYIVRKASEPNALSTIEAIVCALETLEPGGDFQPLLAPFHALVEQQIKAMGPEVFRRHYARR